MGGHPVDGVHSLSITTATNPQTWTAPIGIYTYGATIESGDPLDAFSDACDLRALCDWSFSGIRFKSTSDSKASAINTTGLSPIYFQLCDLAGVQFLEGGSFTSVDACYIHDFDFAINGGSVVIRNCYFNAVTNIHHGSGTFTDVNECYMEGHTNPFAGGVTLSRVNFSTQNSHYVSGTGGGVLASFGNNRLISCVLANNTGAGLTVSDGAHCIVQNVTGTGNTTFGVNLTNGAFLRSLGGSSSVTGTSGDLSVGGAGAKTWAQLPTDDLGSAAGTRQGVIARTS